jgi:predicted ester cyclase
MNQEEHNKAFIMKYFNALYGVRKTDALCRQFVSDQKLIDHILYFDKLFPAAKLVPEEIFAEGDKVFVKGRFYAKHTGEVDGIPPTHKDIEVEAAVLYQIKDDKIVDSWVLSDQLEFLKQIGKYPAEVSEG